MKKIVSVFILLVAVATMGFSQETCTENQEKELTKFDQWFSAGWGMNASMGPTLFFGDVSEEPLSDIKAMISIGLQKQLTPYLYWRLNCAYGNLAGSKDEYSDGSAANLMFKNKYSELNTTLKLDLFGFNDNLRAKKIAPYIYAGVGLMNFRSRLNDSESGATKVAYGYKNYNVTTATHEIEVPLGIGAEWKINQAFSLTLDGSMTLVKSDKVDACVANANDKFLKDMFSTFSLGFVYKFGYRDCDKDGVVNSKDKCPDTPCGVTVNEDGCPLDSDGDGIADFEDKCPNAAGKAELQGCPDSDGDGIADADDKCPDVAGLAQFEGCPDSDGDGIQDSEDKCPNAAGLAEFNGCPDSDGDGVADPDDECPNAAGLAKYNGCPDTDGDGVADNKDACPEVAGIESNNGCPAVKKEVLKVFEKALTGIQFETGKSVIKSSSNSILNDVVKAMKENPTYNLEINGHTDNVGDAQKNLKLSQDRADAVRKYLMDKGVEGDRMTATGYGDTKPVADNSTSAGKAKNRRVEFKVIFKKMELE